MKFFVLFFGLLLSSLNLVAQKTTAPRISEAFSIGERCQLSSKVLNQERILNIYLPHGYHPDSAKTYPVIYLLDGSADEDFLHIVGLVQFGSFSWIEMIPESIVVGIANIDRKHDFSFPTQNAKDQQQFPTTGGSADFIEFIKTELQPYVKSHFKTNGTKTIIGQSLGGLLATEILFKQPALFDNYIIVSPSLWWDDQSLLAFEPQKFTAPKSIFIGVGKEGEEMESTAIQLFAKLSVLNWPNMKLFYEYFEQLDHGDTLHLAAYRAFQKIFKKPKSQE